MLGAIGDLGWNLQNTLKAWHSISGETAGDHDCFIHSLAEVVARKV